MSVTTLSLCGQCEEGAGREWGGGGPFVTNRKCSLVFCSARRKRDTLGSNCIQRRVGERTAGPCCKLEYFNGGEGEDISSGGGPHQNVGV